MEWSEEKNVVLCLEVLLVDPYKVKERTTQRAQLWQQIADNLLKLPLPTFKVDKRAVREHVDMLVKKYKRKMTMEEKASGISPEQSELDILLEEIVERSEVATEHHLKEVEENKEKFEKERHDAEDIRLKAMETYSKSKKRNIETDDSNEPVAGTNTKRRRRASGSDTVAYLKEKAVKEQEYREREIELRSKQLEREEERQNKQDTQHNEFMQMILNQQQQQQQQQVQQFQMVMAQQQQQQLLLTFLNKKAD